MTYGKIAMLRIAFTRTNAASVSGGWHLATVVSGKRPAIAANGASNNLVGSLATNGELHVRNVSGTTLSEGSIMFIYLLA